MKPSLRRKRLSLKSRMFSAVLPFCSMFRNHDSRMMREPWLPNQNFSLSAFDQPCARSMACACTEAAHPSTPMSSTADVVNCFNDIGAMPDSFTPYLLSLDSGRPSHVVDKCYTDS